MHLCPRGSIGQRLVENDADADVEGDFNMVLRR